VAEKGIRWWQSLSSPEAGELIASDPVAILPLAAIEQHGPHLPLSTDLDIGLGLLEAAFRLLAEDVPAWVLPPQAVGCSQEHARFPGTLSLGTELLAGVVKETGEALAGAGVRRLVLWNSHGGNRAVLDAAGLRLRESHGMLVVKASWFRFPHPSHLDLPPSEWEHGLHGGAVETAMMLHLRPELVRQDLAGHARSLGEELEGNLRRVRPEGGASFSWLAGDLNVAGVVGDARRAHATMGAVLIEHYAAVLADVIRDAHLFPLDRLI
jgi:creatinine amidohydrolase